MNIDTAKATAEAEIRALLDNWTRAVRARDIEGIVAHYAPDILAFDAIAQLQFKGRDAYRKHWEACLAMCPASSESMIFEIHDFQIAAGGDLAFGHGLTRCGSVGENGEEEAHWMRATIGYRKTNNLWQVVHEHFSAPFDVQTMKVLDLQP